MTFLRPAILCTILVLLISVTFGSNRIERDSSFGDPSITMQSLRESLDNIIQERQAMKEELAATKKSLGAGIRQLMLQQFYVEEQARSDGNSGVLRIRNDKTGTRPYFAATHTDHRIGTIHDHSQNIRTLGMGELVAVLNGVKFRTRHNDYGLIMRSLNSTEYDTFEDVPFPPVPPEVTSLTDVTEQVAEMKEWFKAWANQDARVRDYRKYFKPILCYLEGGWTNSDQNSIEEPFYSEGHELDASSWLEMQEKIRFTSYAGTKDGLENFAYLPTTIFSTINETIPVIVQWNYRILCHPLKNDLPLNRLNLVDDLKARIALGLNKNDYEKSRAARFQLPTFNSPIFRDRGSSYSFLDDLMAEVPGAEGYNGRIEDRAMGQVAYPIDRKKKDPLNLVFYNRAYRVKTLGAQGLHFRYRGYADENLFVARTNNPKVAGLSFTKCTPKCETWYQRTTYAIPLEFVYLTPLSSWNPYKIQYKGGRGSPERNSVLEGPNGRRNGGADPDKAYNGTHSTLYYMTPLEFFQDEKNDDPADTALDYTHVLDSTGTVRRTRPSGHRVFLPDIAGLGSLRQRYPIFPLHGEGHSVWKEHEALVDMVKNPSKFSFLYDNDELPLTGAFKLSGNCNQPRHVCDMGTDGTDGGSFRDKAAKATYFKLSNPTGGEPHTHDIELTADQAVLYNSGLEVNVFTEEANAHSHDLMIQKRESDGKPVYVKCDGHDQCSDGHPELLASVIR